jgi:hypothetical protein
MPNTSPRVDPTAPDWAKVTPPRENRIDLTVHQLMRFGVSYLPHRPDVAPLIAEADKGFERFLEEVNEGGQGFAYGRERGDDVDTGLIQRRGEPAGDGHYDNKDYFHFRYELAQKPLFQGQNGWFSICSAVLDECRRCVAGFLSELQRQLPANDFARLFCREETRNDDVLRIIHYRKTRPDTRVIARRHRGRAGVVLQVWENYPGLQGLINGQWVPIASSPTHFLCFAGLKLTQLTAGSVEAFDHEVIHVRGAELVQRRSMVAFINPLGVKLGLPTHNMGGC